MGGHVLVMPARRRRRVHRPKPGAWSLAGLGVLTGVGAAIGAVASAGAKGFYLDLARPAWAPIPEVFGPVWTVLYSMMAVAVWLVVRKRKWPGSAPLVAFYGFHLVINGLWTWCFFVWQSGAAAVLDVALLCMLVAMMVVHFTRIEKRAGMLLLPYLAWATYAFALTFAAWRMNPGML